MYSRRNFGINALLAMVGVKVGNTLPPPPDRPGLGSTFKRPINSLTVGVAPNEIEIVATIPPEITAYYNSFGLNVAAAIIKFDAGNAGAYSYIVWGTDPANLTPFLALGGRNSAGTVREIWNMDGPDGTGTSFTQFNVFGRTGATPEPLSFRVGHTGVHNATDVINFLMPFIAFGSGAQISALATTWDLTGLTTLHLDAGTINIDAGGSITLSNDSDISFDGNSIGRGTIFYSQQTVPFNTPAAVGEVAAFTTPNITFEPGRAFAVNIYNGKLKSAVAQNPAVNMRETNLAGPLLYQGARWPVTGFDSPFDPQIIFVNNGGSPVTTSLCLTINPNAATAVTLDAAAGAASWGFEVVDIGPTSRFIGPQSV